MDKHREHKTGREELLQTSALVQVQDLLCSQRRHSSKWNQDIKLNFLNHKSSIEPCGLFKLVKGIRDIEKATQYAAGPRRQFAGENAKRESLRK